MWFQDSGASTVFFAFAVTLDYGVNMAQSGWEADSLGAQDELKVFKCEESELEESGLEMLEIKKNLIEESEEKAKIGNSYPLNASSLRDFAINCAARSMPSNDPRLAPGKYPEKLRNEIEACRSRRIATEWITAWIAKMENGKRRSSY